MPALVDLGEYVQKGNPAGLQFGGDANGARPLRRFDPATATPGAAPNFGQWALPHVLTFNGVVSSLSKVYRPSDEALRDRPEHSRFMRNDLVVMECIETRQRSTALLNWHIEPPDDKNGSHKALAGTLTQMIGSTPRFMQYRENLLHAVFFGRYGVANRWRWKNIAGGQRVIVDRWRPVHGDKLVWRYVPDDLRWDDDQIGIKVGLAYAGGSTNLVAGRWPAEKAQQVAITDQGMAYFLRPWERPLIAVHKHYIEDGEFESPEYAGRVHGVGIRSRIYWTWYQKTETLAWLMEYLERSAGGFEIWYYPWGNETAKQAVEKSARERMSLGRNQLLVPKFLENDQMGQWYDRIEPGMAGAEALKSVIVEYFGHLLKRYILGQTLTTESSGTGLGSNLADVHLATFLQIVKYDATNLEETLTTDLLEPLIRFNFPWAVGLPFKFRIDTESENSQEKLEAYKNAFEMGLKIRAQDVYDIIGATKPAPGDELLDKATQQPDPSSLGGLGALLGKGPSNKPPGQDLPDVPGTAAADAGDDMGDSVSTEPTVERFSALWREADHPRDDAGKFSTSPHHGLLTSHGYKPEQFTDKGDAVYSRHDKKAGGRNVVVVKPSGLWAHATADTKASGKGPDAEKSLDDRLTKMHGPKGSHKKLAGLPGIAERKVDWSSTGGDAGAGIEAAIARKGGQYKSREGQGSLFADEDEAADSQHAQRLHDAVKDKVIGEEQAQTAAEWVRQHGKYPVWNVMKGRGLFDAGTDLIGRVDRGDESFAVHIEPDGELSVYHWPGTGKNRSKRFASGVVPLDRSKAETPPARKAETMLFSAV